MSVAEWVKATRKACSQWAEFFSVIAGEPDPLTAINQHKADDWASFVMDNLAAPGQQKMFALQDEALRNQIGRSMQSVVALHQRLAHAADAGEGSEISTVMLSIDASLQRLAIAMNRVRPTDINERASLPSLSDAQVPQLEDPPEEVTPAERPRPHLQEGSGSGAKAGSGARPQPPPRKQRSAGPPPKPRTAPATTPPPPPKAAPDKGTEKWKPVSTSEDPVIPLTQKKGDSPMPALPRRGEGSGSAPKRRAEGSAPKRRAEGSAPKQRAEGSTPKRRVEGSAPKRRAHGSAPKSRATGKGPLRPAATDPRVALLRTYVKRLDREVLGPEEDAALEQVLAILSGALSSDEETLSRRFRFLDQQYAADDASLFSAPLLRDLKKLLDGLTDQAVQRLRKATDQAQGDRLLFIIGDTELSDSPDPLPVVQLSRVSEGLRPDLLPSYLPRLRGPSAGVTFHVGTQEGASLVRRIPENRLEFGFITGPTRLWLTALHVVRNGDHGALNIEPGGDDTPAYFEARLTLPATEDTYQVVQRFMLAETARFVDRLVSA